DDADAADLLLALDEGSVGGHDVAVALAQHGRGVGRMQPAAEDPDTGRLHVGLYRAYITRNGLQGLGRRWLAAGGITNAEQVRFHAASSATQTNGPARFRQWTTRIRVARNLSRAAFRC